MTFFHNRRTIALIPLAIGILTLLLSFTCIFLLFGGPSRKGLSFAKYHIDLGQLDYDTQVKVNFPFKNTTSNLIKIRKVMADCRCTDVRANKRVIYPDEMGAIEVTFRS